MSDYYFTPQDWPASKHDASRKQGWYLTRGLVRDPIRPVAHLFNPGDVSPFNNAAEAQAFVIQNAIAGDPLCREAIAMLMSKRLQGETA